MVLLTSLSAFSRDPINLFLKGPSSIGKSYNVTNTLRFFGGDVWWLGGLSPTALVHEHGILMDLETGEEIPEDWKDKRLEELLKENKLEKVQLSTEEKRKVAKLKRQVQREYSEIMRRSVVCVSEGEAKNLSQQRTRQKRAAGATTQAETKGKILEYAWWMDKNGYSSVTVRVNVCHVSRKVPFIPTEQELDTLIAGCGRKTTAFLQLLKETAMRAGEARTLSWTDIDFQHRNITLNTPEKHGNARMFSVSSKLIDMLATLPKRNEKVFSNTTMSSLKSSFYRSRKTCAGKLQNPRLLRITFHTFRHWKATTLYHQTKDPIYVKEFLGHRKLDTTMLYIQIEQALYREQSDEFTVKVASKPEEIKTLLEVGFEYVCDKDGLMFFRKRK